MRIVFLQNMSDALGGVHTVNQMLMNYFADQGHEVVLISMRISGGNDVVEPNHKIKTYIINENEIWDCPRLNVIVDYLKQGQIITSIKQLSKRKSYDKGLATDYNKLNILLEEQNPDVIVNGHYEILTGIQDKFLSRTINHFHTSFGQVLENRSYVQIFNQYKDKIHKFVWLSKNTCDNALKYGYDNSVCIYNPIQDREGYRSHLKNNKVVFIGRISEEKRIHKAMDIFRDATADELHEWTFQIYGYGALLPEIEERLERNANIEFMGATHNTAATLQEADILILTSRFEGWGMVIQEAAVCGVPSIAYDYGEAVSEVILDKETGYIVEQDNHKEFVDLLRDMMYNYKVRKEFGDKAKTYLKDFSINTVGEQWLKLFNEIIEKQK